MSRSARSRSHDRWDPRLTAHALLRSSPRDRGTILLMVVGVLALLAIIGVVYATLGKSDRTAGASRVKTARSAEQVEDVGNYLAGIIADATFATYPELTGRNLPNANDAEWIPRVRGYTFPLTDKHLLSVPPTAPYIGNTGQPAPSGSLFEYALFSPTGTGVRYADWSNFGAADPREYGDPYLAAFEPEFLGLSTVINTAGDLANRHDWRSISNFSPRGNFVNLANLRPSRGGFNAAPGFTAGKMSYGLTLYDRNSGLPLQAGTNFKWPQVRPDGTLDLTVDANPLVPAHWTMNQVWAFRPAVADERDANNAIITPASYEYAFNQWADADGDGFFDSRWFEIADIKDLFGNTAYAKAMLSPRGRARIMVAARCIDSSAMVNVNSSTDTTFGGQSISPTGPALTRDWALPPGASPAEINLRRILSATDISPGLAATGVPANVIPYAGLPRPSSTTSPELASADYSLANNAGNSYNSTAAPQVGGRGYAAVVDGRVRGVTEQTNHWPAGTAARYPYQRINGYTTFVSPGHASRYFTDASGYGSYGVQTPFDLADELELRAFFGVNDSDTLSRLEATLGGRMPTPAKYRDYSPLRDNRPRSLEMAGRDEFGPTDLFKDYNPTSDTAHRQALLSVFSDVRHLLTTVNGARPIKDDGVAPHTAPDGSIVTGSASTDISAALAAISNFGRFDRTPRATDPERYPGGNTNLAPLDWRLPARDDFNNYQKAVQLIFRLYLNSIAPYTDEYFYPGVWTTANAGNAADPAPFSPDETYLRGLVYGGNAELAVQMAAHMTANLIDAFDRERKLNLDPINIGTPNARPNGTGRAVVDASGAENPGIDRTEPFVFDLQSCLNPQLTTPQTTNAHKDLHAFPPTLPAANPQFADDHRLAPAVTDLKSRNAYNTASGMKKIFGVEPQPFIAEIAWFGLYSGNPAQGGVPGGSSGSGVQVPPSPPAPGNSSPFDPRQVGQPSEQTIRIVTTPDLMGNDDFIGEIIAVALNNPFDQDVVLYDPRLGPSDAEGAGEPSHPPTPSESRRIDRFRYYLEYAGRYYAFARQKIDQIDFASDAESRNDPVLLRAGETRVFYFTNPGSLQAIANRANTRVGGSSAFTATTIEEWLAGKWTNGKPEANSNQAMGNGQLFLRNSFNVSSSTFPQRTDGDPSKPQPILQVYPTTFNKVGVWPAHGTDYMDLWGFDPRGSGDESLKQVNFSNGGNPEHAPARRVAQLWRTRRSESSSQVAPYRLGGDLLGGANQDVNDFSNDYLADRLRDPVGDTLDPNGGASRGSLYEPRVALEGAGNISITHSGSPIPSTLTFIAHGHIRRPTDTDIDPLVPPTGTYPVARGTARVDHGAFSGRRLGTVRGVLPPWCLEVRSDDDIDWGTTRLAGKWSLNLGESNPTTATIPNFRVEGPYIAPIMTIDTSDTAFLPQPTREHFSSLTDLFAYRGPVNTEIGKPCEQKLGNDIHVNRDLKDFKDVAVEYYDVGEDRLGGAGTEYETITTHIGDTIVQKTVPIRRSRNSALFSRSGDFLLPLAVGPWFDPSRAGVSQGTNISTWTGSDPDILDREVQWMTLSEAIALSTGYFGPRDNKDPFWRFGQNDLATANRKPRTDRGHLAIDRFSPYLKKGSMAVQPLGSGVPFALSVIDQFRTQPGVSSTPIGSSLSKASPFNPPFYPPSPEAMPSTNAFGGGNAALAGTVSANPDALSSVTSVPGPLNVNTAPRTNARTIAMLSPSQAEDYWMFDPNAVGFLGYQTTAPGTPPLIDTTSGAAAAATFYGLSGTLEAYRNNALRIPPNATSNPNAPVLRGDPGATDIAEVRTARGIKSLGEFGVMNYHNVAAGVATDVVPIFSMLHYATPETTQPTIPNRNGGTALPAPRLSGHPELASGGHYDRRPDGRIQDGTLAAWQTTAPTPAQTARRWFQQSGGAEVMTPTANTTYNILQSLGSPQVERNYQDKLAILNAVTGAATVRSDVFTVYFLVHAYTPEDVDIPDSQPLVPSMAKRFVMVVDRSSVKSLGDKPKILLLKEVPTN